MKQHTVSIDSGKVFNDDDLVKSFEEYGDKVVAVDINGAYVAQTKAKGSLEDSEENIRKRFNLGK